MRSFTACEEVGGDGEGERGRCNFVHSLSKRLEEKVGAIKKESCREKGVCFH